MPRLSTFRPTLLAAAASLAAAAFAAPLPDDTLLPYTVTTHDTLIGLNRTLFATPGTWKEVARINHLSNQDLIRPGQVLQVPARLLRSKVVPARVVSVFGDVRIGGQPAATGAVFNVGDSIRTAAGSTAVVELADGSRVRLAPSTEGSLDEQRRFQLRPTAAAVDDGLIATSLRLLSGSIEVFASKVLRARPLEVSTPTAVIGVRGTTYRVRNDVTQPAGGGTVINASATEVLEGKVHAQVGNSAAQSVDITANFGASLQPGRQPVAVPLPSAPGLAGLPTSFDHLPVVFRAPGTLPVRVQLANDAAFDHIQIDLHAAPGAEIRIPQLADGTWHLRVRAISPEGLEGVDAVSSFQLRSRQQAPALVEPAASAKRPLGDVTLRWTPAPDTAAYALEVARDAEFTAIVLRDAQVHDAQRPFHPVDTEFGAADGTYWWRVATVGPDGGRGDWSAAHALVLRPTPRAPMASVSEDGGAIELRWGGSPQDRTEVQLAADGAFAQVVARADFTSSAGTLPRPPAGAYFARYRFVEPDGFTTAWSGATRVEVQSNWHQAWRALFLATK